MRSNMIKTQIKDMIVTRVLTWDKKDVYEFAKYINEILSLSEAENIDNGNYGIDLLTTINAPSFIQVSELINLFPNNMSIAQIYTIDQNLNCYFIFDGSICAFSEIE
jgi:hypothetical protein